jgi:hypothetical protein
MATCYKYVYDRIKDKGTASKEEKLENADTAHDYWRGERGDLIQDVLYRIYNPEKYVETELGYNKSLSGQFEPELESYFDVKFGYPSLCESQKYGKVYWTIYELMADYGVGGAGPKTFLKTIVKNPMIKAIQLQIPTGSEKRALFTDPSKISALNYAVNCIIQFYAGKPLSDEELSLVTIDANSGALPCLFQNFKGNIKTNANALTICDSASGGVDESSSSKCGKSHFTRKYQPLLFPFNIADVIAKETVPARRATLNEIQVQYRDANGIGRAYVIQSNYFTRDTHVLFYTEKEQPFSVDNKCSIVFHVKVITLDGQGKDYSAPFGYTSTGKVQSGTPVPVLRELIRTIEDLWGTKPLITALKKIGDESDRFNIVPIIEAMIYDSVDRDTIIKVLLDYKRGGDHEQINAMKETKKKTGCTLQILATGDNLCRTKANEQGENSAYTHGDKLDLCRFPPDTLTPDQIAAQKIAIATAETTRLKLALTARISQIKRINITREQLEDYKSYLDTWMTQYGEQPLTLLTLDGLQHKIDTYLGTETMQLEGVSPPELFKSYIEKIEAVSAETDQKTLIDLDDELRVFFYNVDTMRTLTYDREKNLLGIGTPDPGTLAPGTPGPGITGPGTPRSSPNSISNKFRKAPFFGIDLTPNVELIKIVGTMIAFNNSNSRRRGNKVMKANIEETILRFQELMLQVLDNYKSNMSILPPFDTTIIKEIEEIEERVESFRLSDPLFDKSIGDDMIIYDIVDDSKPEPEPEPEPVKKKPIQFDDEDPIQKLLGPLHETESLGIMLSDSDSDSDSDGDDDDDDDMDMGASATGMDLSTDDAEPDLNTSEGQNEIVLRRSPRLSKKNRIGGTRTPKECSDIKTMDIKEAIIVGSDEVMPFITSVVSEYKPAYYYQAMINQLNYLQSEKTAAAATTVPILDKKITIQQDIMAGFDQAIVAVAAAGHITIDYNAFIEHLITIDNIAIENVYAGLSVGFNAYMYSYLQDKCDASTDNMTIIEALNCLPNEMKLLIFITNLMEDYDYDTAAGKKNNKRIDFSSGNYGNQVDVWNALVDVKDNDTPGSTPTSGKIADISNTIYYIYNLNDIHKIYCYVIQFFGIAKKYFIDKSDQEELLITQYFSVSKESNSLILAAIKSSSNYLDGLKFLIANFLVAVLHNTIDDVYSLPAAAPASTPASGLGKRKNNRRGGSKTRRKKRPSKKRNMKTKRNKRSNNKYTRSNAKKHNSRKLKKKNRKKRTTHRKK